MQATRCREDAIRRSKRGVRYSKPPSPPRPKTGDFGKCHGVLGLAFDSTLQGEGDDTAVKSRGNGGHVWPPSGETLRHRRLASFKFVPAFDRNGMLVYVVPRAIAGVGAVLDNNYAVACWRS
jgi:hypothetical protein